jgi:hypothetical protein
VHPGSIATAMTAAVPCNPRGGSLSALLGPRHVLGRGLMARGRARHRVARRTRDHRAAGVRPPGARRFRPERRGR